MRSLGKRLVIATAAVGTPMGAQNYEKQITARAPDALAPGDHSWTVDHLVIRSMRSTLPGNRRLPMGLVIGMSMRSRRRIGRWLYGRGDVIHRMSLELPPSPYSDVMTVHDVVSWRYPDESPPVDAAIDEARAADAVICVSEFTAQEAVDLLGVRNPWVVPNGVDERFYDATPLDDAARQRLGIFGPYVLHTGGATQRKNLESLADAWSVVHRERPGLQLVLAGPPHPRRSRLLAHLPQTKLLGRVPDEVVPNLVAAADAVVVPSLYEGFGLPVLEAMAANVAVVAADTSSLPEVAGHAAILVPPTSSGLAEGILNATSDDPEVAARVTAGRSRATEFSWERSAEGHASVWKALA